MSLSDHLLRVLLDTSVLVASFRSRSGASRIILQLAFEHKFEMAASNAVFLEYEDVLQREFQREAHGRSVAEVDLFLVALSKIIHPVELYFQWRPQLTDPNDEMILEAAINGRVDAIVTHNLRILNRR